MRYSCDSSTYWWSSAASARAEARSCPKGFSTTTLAPLVRPGLGEALTTVANRNGGISR